MATTATKKQPVKKPAPKKTPTKKGTTRKPVAPKRENLDPWEQQPNESMPAFQAFTIYRDAGLTRTIAKVAKECKKTPSLLGRWSRVNSWTLRSSAWDREMDRDWLLEQRVMRRRASKRNATTAALAMQKVGAKLLEMTTKDLDAQSVARLMEAASKLERLALGESTENVSVSGPGGGPVQVDVGVLTDEERRTRMETLMRELGSRLRTNEEDE